MPRHLMYSLLLLPAAVLALTLGAAADQATTGQSDDETAGATAVAVGDGDAVYEVKLDDQTASAATIEPQHLVLATGAFSLAALDEVRALVDELSASGDLSEAGAEKLRGALDKLGGAVDLPLGLSTGGKSVTQGKTIVIERQSPDKAETKRQVKTYSIVIGSDGDKSALDLKPGQVGLVEPLTASGADATVHSLTIVIGDDGQVTVNGEGYSPEELAQISEQVEAAGTDNVELESLMEQLDNTVEQDQGEVERALKLAQEASQEVQAQELAEEVAPAQAEAGGSAAQSDAQLDEDIAAVLKDVEQLLREFAARHSGN